MPCMDLPLKTVWELQVVQKGVAEFLLELDGLSLLEGCCFPRTPGPTSGCCC